MRLLGSADEPHTWTFVDDVARLLVTVAADERAWGRAWHVPSQAPRTQREVVADLGRAAGVAPVEIGVVPRALLRTAGLVSPPLRELGEVLHQMEGPFLVDSSAAARTFGIAPTPWQDAPAAVVAQYRPAGEDVAPTPASQRRVSRRAGA